MSYQEFTVIEASCGQLPVVLGSAPARDLYDISFADVLDESAERGYQRPFDVQHAREFRAYIEQPSATTIPLALNLRGVQGDGWRIIRDGGHCVLQVRRPGPGAPAVLARVDCQHRLGMMADSNIPLTFQCFLGLTVEEEMAIFSIINGKAKGLSSSLLDYHTTKLVPNYHKSQLELYIAKRLNEDPDSVWRGAVKLGGVGTQGSQRRVSLRGLQTATKTLLKGSSLGGADLSPEAKYHVVRDFWTAVASVWADAWRRPRNHLLTKGVGVMALSMLAGDIVTVCLVQRATPGAREFEGYLRPLERIDWSNSGPFKGFGGRQGAAEAHDFLRSRLSSPSKVKAV